MCIYPDGNSIQVEITSFNNDLFDPTIDQPVLRARSWDLYGIDMAQEKSVNDKKLIIKPNINNLWWPERGKNDFYASFDSGEKWIWVGPVTVSSYGYLKVTILPEEIASIGGWRQNKISTQWYGNGDIVELPSGHKELTFKPVEGWKTPSNYAVHVPVDETEYLTITYQKSFDEYQYAIDCPDRESPLSCTTTNGHNWYYIQDPVKFQKDFFIMNVNCDETNQCKAIIEKIDHSQFSSIGIMYIQEGTGESEGYKIASAGVEETFQIIIPLPLNEKWPGNNDEIEIYARYEQELIDVTPWVWTGPITIKRFQPDTTLPDISIFNPINLDSYDAEVPIGGSVSDKDGSGVFSVDIQIKNGDVYWNADRSSWDQTSAWNSGHVNETMSEDAYDWYFTGPASIDNDKNVIITARATDFAGNSAYTSVFKNMFESNISCNTSKSHIVDGEKFKIFGSIDVQDNHLLNVDENILISIISPDGITQTKQDILQSKPSYEFVFDCDNPFNKKGVWSIISSWKGNNIYKKAVSDPISITIENAITDITIDTSIKRVKLYDPVTISGKLTPFIPAAYLDCCDYIPKDIPLALEISNSETLTQINLSTNDHCGHYKHDFKGFNKSGLWNVKVKFNGMETYSASSSEITINVVKNAGYAITFLGEKTMMLPEFFLIEKHQIMSIKFLKKEIFF